MVLTVSEIARLVGGTVYGDPAVGITGVNGLDEATEGDLTFARDARYFANLKRSFASAALAPQPVPDAVIPIITVGQPDLAFLQVAQHFSPDPILPKPGIHAMAVLDEGVALGDNAAIGPFVHVESGTVIGDNVVLYAGVYIGCRCVIGNDTIIYPNATIREGCKIGARCIIHSGACIGSDGFGFAPMDGRWHKIPQTGTVHIGDDVEIGSNPAIDRATFGVTRIGCGCKIDNLVQIAHNVILGEHCAVAGMAGVAGSARVGNHVRIGANAGIVGHITVGDNVTIGGRAGVTRSIEAGAVVSGFPAISHEQQRRVLVAQQRTPEMLKRLAQLERRIQELEDKTADETTDNS
jgi:UDP-3-O-[3-hydroxymyristoyl] glucosamine N-acyltransferase